MTAAGDAAREVDMRRARPAETFDALFAAHTDAIAARRRWIAVPTSMALHVLAAAAVIVVPLLLAETLPGTGVRAFFVEPMAVPAPPPPPPPLPGAAAAARTAPRTEAKTGGLVPPVEVPTDIRPEAAIDIGSLGGDPNGVPGGVPDGVVGAIVADQTTAPPKPAAVTPVRVGGVVHEPRKVVNVAPVYPELALRAGLEGIVIIEATIDERGRVQDAKVLRGVPVLDAAALDALRQWVYTPTLLDGVPTPVIMTVTVRFMVRAASR
jgi:protein TonB